MDTLTIITGVSLAIYDVVGILLIVWAIWTVCTMKRGRS
jgi:hypothetical protein